MYVPLKTTPWMLLSRGNIVHDVCQVTCPKEECIDIWLFLALLYVSTVRAYVLPPGSCIHKMLNLCVEVFRISCFLNHLIYFKFVVMIEIGSKSYSI